MNATDTCFYINITKEENSAFNLFQKKRENICVYAWWLIELEKNEKLWGKYEKLSDTPIKNYWSKI